MQVVSAPVIGITPAFDDGTDVDSVRPNSAVHFVDAAYGQALERAGAVAVVLPVTESPASIERYVDVVDGLVLSGGGGYLRRRHRERPILPDLKTLSPRRYRFEAALLRRALERDLPVLGICRGHQMIARVSGGKIYSQISGRVPGAQEHYLGEGHGRRPVHDIYIEPGTLLHAILGTTTAGTNSLHRQAVARVVPPFVISARAGDGVAEALESRGHRFVVGVQFHPELLLDSVPIWRRLFEAFVDACRETWSRGPGLISVPAGS
ncbi:MAG: gamma-glutamyl-gamma-aminobutyrate hydrolase family protein [Limnochordales bacterium]|nr:peptidase C26 [Bacillota bacterium]